jgi:acetyltransferase-like isoleucine patch superfamily enzyme
LRHWKREAAVLGLRSAYGFLADRRRRVLGALFRLVFAGSGVSIGRRLRLDGWPIVAIDRRARLTIGDDVVLRHHVELRVHGEAHLSLGDRTRIDRGVRLLATNRAVVTLGPGVRIGLCSVLNGGDDITVGAKSLISGFVYLQSSMHNFTAGSGIQDQGYSHAPIHLGPDCWLAAHVVVMPGCQLAEGTVVGSNAVVTKSFSEKGAVLAGVPAQVIKERIPQSVAQHV